MKSAAGRRRQKLSRAGGGETYRSMAAADRVASALKRRRRRRRRRRQRGSGVRATASRQRRDACGGISAKEESIAIERHGGGARACVFANGTAYALVTARRSKRHRW